MELTNYSPSDIDKIKIIQRTLRYRLKEIKKINDKMNKVYNVMYGMMKRIHNNFILGIIDQFEYNSNMNILDTQMSNFQSIPRPFKLKDYFKDYENI
jgi:DNA-binding transcriptional MerR regulator